MRKYIFVLLLSIILVGCTNENESEAKKGINPENTTEAKLIKENDEILFPNGNGSVKIEYEKNAINFVVLAKGLNTGKTYSINLHRNDKGGVTFGPKENVEIKAGENWRNDFST